MAAWFARRGHDVSVRSKQLRGNGMLIVLEIKVVESARGLPRDSFGAGELGHDESTAAQAANDAAEYGVGNTGHWG